MLPPAASKNLVVRVALEGQKSWVCPMRFLMWQLVIRLQHRVFRYSWIFTISGHQALLKSEVSSITHLLLLAQRRGENHGYLQEVRDLYLGEALSSSHQKNLAREYSGGCIRPGYGSHYSYLGIIIWHFFIIFP
jgi:hypothetical protein